MYNYRYQDKTVQVVWGKKKKNSEQQYLRRAYKI